jgi:hypothetical protein
MSDVVNNNPSELIILIPALKPGTYQVGITSQFSGSGGKGLKEPRTTIFDRLLTVTEGNVIIKPKE